MSTNIGSKMRKDSDESVSSKTTEFVYEEDTWKVIKSYLKETGLISHQLDSFNYFVEHLMPKITKQYNPITVHFPYRPKKTKSGEIIEDNECAEGDIPEKDKQYSVYIYFDNLVLGKTDFRENNGKKCNLTPHISRMRNFTYSCPLYVDVIIKTVIRNKTLSADSEPLYQHTHCINKVDFGNLPIMVKSKCCILNNKGYCDKNECPNDLGGYFIVSGQEKVIISQDEGIPNMPVVYKRNTDKVLQQGEICSISSEKYGITRKFDIILTKETSQKHSTLKAVIPNIKHNIPIYILFKALGLDNDKEITTHLLMDIDIKEHTNIPTIVKDSIYESYSCLEKNRISIIKSIKAELATYEQEMNEINKEQTMDLNGKDDDTYNDSDGKETSEKETDDENKNDPKPQSTNTPQNKPLKKMKSETEIKYLREKLDKIGHSLSDTDLRTPKEQAYDYIIEYVSLYYHSHDHLETAKKKQLTHIFKKEFLPQISEDDEELATKLKIMQTSYFANKILKVHCNEQDYDSQDSNVNKRIHTPCILLANLYKMVINKLVKEIRQELPKEFKQGAWRSTSFGRLVNETNIYNIIKSVNIIDAGLKYALKTGNWGAQKASSKKGISQSLNRYSYKSTVSNLRRVVKAIDSSAKVIAPRQLDSTHIMALCPAETPEGKNVGVVKNLALATQITQNHSDKPIKRLIDEFNVVKVQNIPYESLTYHWCKIFINGTWYGILDIYTHPNDFVTKLRKYRSQGIIHPHISITWYMSDNLIIINTDGGRFIHPMYKVRNNELLITKSHVKRLSKRKIKYGFGDTIRDTDEEDAVIEYIDTEELENCYVAQDISYLRNAYTQMNGLSSDKISKELGGQSSESTDIDNTIVEYDEEDESVEDVEQTSSSEDVTEDSSEYDTTSLSKNMYEIENYYTHCELHPALMFGILASDIPLPDHDQAPRLAYQSSMGKQAMGTYALNFNARVDTHAYLLHSPEHPIVGNRLMRMLQTAEMSAGVNSMIAIATFTGYNQEDSLIANQTAIDSGLFHSTFFRGYKSDESKSTNSSEDSRFGKPDTDVTRGVKYGDYSKLDKNGFISKDMYVKGNDAIIGRILPLKNRTDKFRFKDSSTLLRANEDGYVNRVFVSRNDDGFRVCKVGTRSIRIPGIGDKFASRHGQKGIIGMTYRREDMPFTEDGLTPDLIMNPHAVPSRMTIGHLVEALLGKACVNIGKYGDGTPFTDMSVEQIGDILEENGFERYGNELMYDPRSGKQFPFAIYYCPTYYQRLKHMVDDKMHSRARGPVSNMVRQPTEGRNRDGGFRTGEMERDALISHGAAAFLKETFLERSDHFKIYTCTKCRKTAQVNRERNIYHCKSCKSYCGFSEIHLPYAMKLFKQEVGGMSINMNMLT